MTHQPAPIPMLDLFRISNNDDGTPGYCRIDGHTFATLELPWRNNEPNKSCVMPGTYLCIFGTSPSFPQHYELQNVPSRDGIVLHAGTYAGDASMGYASQSKGCIFLGRACVMPGPRGKSQRALCLSKSAIATLNQWAAGLPFWLRIHDPLSDADLLLIERPQLKQVAA